MLDADTLEIMSDRQASGASSDAPPDAGDVFEMGIGCPREFGKLRGRLSLGRGCKELKLFSPDGDLFWDVPIWHEAQTLLYNGRLLAVEIHRHRPDPFDLGIQSKPLRIALYDLARKSEKCSIRITEAVSGPRSMFYALSPAGGLAVIQGTKLSLYQP